MLTEKIKFKDHKGIEKIETWYFNLTEEQIFNWELEEEEGLQSRLEKAMDSKDLRALAKFVRTLLEKSVGEQSPDGTRFDQSPEVKKRFFDAAFYSDFFFSLFLDNGNRAQKYINAVLPADLVRRAAAQAAGQKVGREDLNPKERWDARERAKQTEPEIIDFTSFGDEGVQDAYSGAQPIQVDAPENPAPPIPATVPGEEFPQSRRDAHERAVREVREHTEAAEREEFLAWKASKDAENNEPAFRPPHESGPGQEFNQE